MQCFRGSRSVAGVSESRPTESRHPIKPLFLARFPLLVVSTSVVAKSSAYGQSWEVLRKTLLPVGAQDSPTPLFFWSVDLSELEACPTIVGRAGDTRLRSTRISGKSTPASDLSGSLPHIFLLEPPKPPQTTNREHPLFDFDIPCYISFSTCSRVPRSTYYTDQLEREGRLIGAGHRRISSSLLFLLSTSPFRLLGS